MEQSERGSDPAGDIPTAGIRAAQYVRMSTEHQKYSTENQTEIIRAYAKQRGITIVRTYADEGKSGLRLDGRNALKRLIDDVQHKRADFSTILVYDVSRWGRFQDADESAYYEYLCKNAGITVRYCAEQFENDGSLSATIIKSMKRAMAGEYSRELSAKVFTGQCRLITLGFRQGGPAGYGLRRQLIDEHHDRKAELARGEYKSLQTDRVILVPGPQDEVKVVLQMYRMFANQRKSECEIAAILNGHGLTTDLGRPWTRGTVRQVLTNEKYVGNNVYNHVSFKLKKTRVQNPPEMWIRADHAFEAIVNPKLFFAVQQIIHERSKRFSDTELLERLARLFHEKGWLSGVVIDETEGMPASCVYRNRFGSLLRAYELIGYSPGRDYRYIEINRALRAMHPGIVGKAISDIEQFGGTVIRDPVTDLLTINDEFSASIVIARCLHTAAGSLRWQIRFDTGLRPDITVALRMAESNRQILDYYVLPRIDMEAPRIRLAEENAVFLDSYRFDSLEPFLHLTKRSQIRMAA